MSSDGPSGAAPDPRREARLPLEGVRVLSQAIVWAGPAASLILADLGAEVIEIESIQHVNPTRSNYRNLPELYLQGPFGALYTDRDPSEGFWNRNAHFNYSKRNHKSITLDIERPAGIGLLRELVRVSDVYIENNAVGVVEKFGLDYPRLAELNPRIIQARFPGFGTTGPYRRFKGFAPTMDALGGHTFLRGYRDSDPSFTPGLAHGDPNAGIHVAFAVQAALFARERTGRGQMIDLSHVEAGLHHISWALMDYSFNGRVRNTFGNRHPSKAPSGVFRCTDAPGEQTESSRRRWIAIAVASDEQFAALAAEMGAPELADDPRFATLEARYEASGRARAADRGVDLAACGARADGAAAGRRRARRRAVAARRSCARTSTCSSAASGRKSTTRRRARTATRPRSRASASARCASAATPRCSASTTARCCRTSSASATSATPSSSTPRSSATRYLDDAT